jgi:glucose-6-phosphate 1-dehydrogenase
MASPNIVFTLFGATGDLAQKKIMPALLNLYTQEKISHDSVIIAFSRRPWTNDEYRTFIEPSLTENGVSKDALHKFLKHVVYAQGNFDGPTAFDQLKNKIEVVRRDRQVFFHLAVQPEFYEPIALGLKNAGITDSAKIIIEKPIGHNLKTAELVESALRKGFTEENIFRIDHYLGKAGLHDLVAVRQKDSEFESHLNKDFVKTIEIKILEQIAIEGRGEFYETVGAIRDVGQNHALEMLAMVTMDMPPNSAHIPEARAKVLQRLVPITTEKIAEHIIRAQYKGYRQEQDVDAHSETETYFKIKTEINNDRWQNVHISLEGGKAFELKVAEIKINFSDGTTKVCNIERAHTPDAYEVVLEKAIESDKTYFVSIDEVKASWKFIDPILEHIKDVSLKFYDKGVSSASF